MKKSEMDKLREFASKYVNRGIFFDLSDLLDTFEVDPETRDVKCSMCGGEGSIIHGYNDWRKCETCGGTGKINEKV